MGSPSELLRNPFGTPSEPLPILTGAPRLQCAQYSIALLLAFSAWNVALGLSWDRLSEPGNCRLPTLRLLSRRLWEWPCGGAMLSVGGRSRQLLGIIAMQAYRVGDLVELLVAHLFELLAFGGELLVDFDCLFRHHLVGFLRAAGQNEVGPGGQPLVAVRVEADSQHHGLPARVLLLRIRHAGRLTAARERVNALHAFGAVNCWPLSPGPSLRRKGTALLAHSAGER